MNASIQRSLRASACMWSTYVYSSLRGLVQPGGNQGLGVSSSRNGVSGSRGVFFPGMVFSVPGRVFVVPTKVCLVPTVFWVPAWVFWVPTSSTRPGLKNPCSIITPGCY